MHFYLHKYVIQTRLHLIDLSYFRYIVFSFYSRQTICFGAHQWTLHSAVPSTYSLRSPHSMCLCRPSVEIQNNSFCFSLRFFARSRPIYKFWQTYGQQMFHKLMQTMNEKKNEVEVNNASTDEENEKSFRTIRTNSGTDTKNEKQTKRLEWVHLCELRRKRENGEINYGHKAQLHQASPISVSPTFFNRRNSNKNSQFRLFHSSAQTTKRYIYHF